MASGRRNGMALMGGAGIAAGVLVLALFAAGALPGLAARPSGGDASPGATVPPGPGHPVESPAQTAVSPSTAPSPEPTLELVPAPLTGLPVTPDAAGRHPIAVMVDDHADARPQSGFNAASIVWQAPAEGGIPRYMLIFQDTVPGKVGPVRSSRQYFIEWAAEWRAMYVHAGGSPQALATLAARGTGGWVWNADAFRWEGSYLTRVHAVTVPGGQSYPLVPPHNLYTDGARLRRLAARLKAADGPLTPVWSFGPDALPENRPIGARLTVAYPYETIAYRYDAPTNTYHRYINGSKKAQVDAADGRLVGPKNVVILRMAFGPLNDGHPAKQRLEASDVGHGTAWISTNGVTRQGTWRKASPTAPTLLFGPDGKAVTLTAGQTFVEVVEPSYGISIRAGHLPPPPPMHPGGLSPT
jgi:hypothetical protein